ncbi:branched-chain-amino-acid transaminase [bacterium]|nr:branched-chain-amino-acid transaminase [bacterium]
MGLCVYVNGKFYDTKEAATVSVFDHGFLYGDGVFEGIRVYDGRIFKGQEHFDRLYRSAKTLNINIPMEREELIKTTIETIRRTGLRDVYIRLVVSRGIGDLGLNPKKCGLATLVIIAGEIHLYPPERYEQGLKVITCATRRNRPDTVNCQVKSLNYLNNVLAVIEVVNAGADEGIMLNEAGYVGEATADNIFIVNEGILETPPSYMGILEGITRATIIKIAEASGIKVHKTGILMHDIYNADECFLTGSGAELIPVIEADRRMIGNGKPGTIFKMLLKKFRDITKTDGIPVYDDVK